MSANKRFNKLKKPKQDEIRVQVRRPSKGAQEAGDETSSKQPVARKPTAAAQGGVTNPSISNSKPPAKRKRPTPVPDDDDSVPTDSSDDGKQLTLIKLKRTIKRHARWCPFVRLNRKIRNSHRRIEAMIASFDSDGDSEDDQESLPAAKKRRTKKSNPKPKPKFTGNDDDENDSEDEDEDGDDDEQTARKKATAASREPQDPESQEFENEGKLAEATGDNDKEPTSATQREPKPKPKPKPTKASQKSANEDDSAQLQQRKSNQAQAAAKKSATQRQGKASENGPPEAGPSVRPFASKKKIEDSSELGKRVKPAGELTDESDLSVAKKPMTEVAGQGKGRAS